MIASDPMCKDGNVRFTTVTFKDRCLIKYELDMDVRLTFNFKVRFLYKSDVRIPTAWKTCRNFLNWTLLYLEKREHLPQN